MSIRQHIFTRCREGVFRSNEGHDTIAMSPSLEKRFVESVLQSYCVYRAPRKLLEHREEDDSKFPDSLTVLPSSNGELVIGRSIYVSSDFTGSRSTIFVHQFIIPENRKEKLYLEPDRIFGIRSFKNKYEIGDGNGKDLTELEQLEYDHLMLDPDEMLRLLGIERTRFLQLLYAVMLAIGGGGKSGAKRKVYVALKVDISDCSEWAKKLSAIIFSLLPYAVRRQLGVITYHNEPESKQNIQLMFVEPGSIALAERSVERDMLFDFRENLFRNVELPGNEHNYLDFVWDNRKDSGKLTDFFEFCEMALAGLAEEKRLAVATYYQLCGLYLIDQERSRYRQNRPGTLTLLSQFLTKETIQAKGELENFLKALLTDDLMRSPDFIPDSDYVQSLLHNFGKSEALNDFLSTAVALCICKISDRHRNASDSFWVLKSIPRLDEKFTSVITKMIEYSPGVLEAYVIAEIQKAGTVKEFGEIIGFWSRLNEEFLNREWFQEIIIQIAKKVVEREKNPIIAAKSVLNLIDKYFSKIDDDKVVEYSQAICGELLIRLDPYAMELEKWEEIGFLVNRFQGDQEQDLGQKLSLFRAVYKVLFSEKDSDILDAWEKLNTPQQAKYILHRLFQNTLDESKFHRLTYVYYFPDSVNEYDYYKLLDYVSVHGSKDLLINFILWSVNNRKFMNSATYIPVLKKYLLDKQPKLMRTKDFKKQLRAVLEVDEYKEIYRPKRSKYFIWNKKQLKWIAFSILALGLIGVSVVIILLLFSDSKGNSKVETRSPSSTIKSE
ncbi:GAP1-N2 domain-containing protein [Paenibacillus koleovorans]|uniref:GAP1-N2 domain-containing protein n=1 Tax=Paenibacillus koleovorans TaxID=121608 RepID=UPI000FD7FA3A|nr:hypothetical protein [Paenibacillus koleovorans]